MLNNLTNFLNIIAAGMVKKTLSDTDLIAVGTKDKNYDGGYKPTAITFEDLQAQLGGGTPSYKVYTALLNQTGATEPTAIVLDNTLGGNVIWTRDGVGIYTATLIGAFPDENKFFTLNAATEIYSANSQILVYWNDINSFQLTTFAGNGITIPFTPTDDLIFNYPLEIKVYY